MRHPLLLILLACLLGMPNAFGQPGEAYSMQHSPAYEAAAAPLRGAAPRQYNFSRAVLSDVMRLMAEDAGIGFFGLPDGTEGSDRLVTFTLTASPFVALETLAKANGVTLIHDNGIWYLRPANDQELIGRIYEINYNAQEIVTKNSQGGGGGGGFSAGGGTSGGIGGGIGGGGSTGLNLQGSPDFFVTEPSRILEDIRNILDLPTTGGTASFAPTASVDTLAQLSVAGLPGNPTLVPGAGATGGEASGDADSKVIWNSDSNTLYVVATRQQHQWIEAYLESADRPQPMISVEVKFIETSRDPSTDFGIDWNGVLGDEGLDVTLSDNSGPIDLNRIGSYSLPTAVLSYSDLTWRLRAIYEDRNTRAVSFPRMVTLDNREVSFRSVVNQPVLGSSASASLGAGGTQTSSIEYLPIGTVINILPKRMAGDKVLLNVSLTVSDIIGTEVINGNPFPIATSRVYTAPLTVKSGYTVAISGLDAARTENRERGVPVLGRLPVLGPAFRNRKRDRHRQHLMMLITPVALDSGTQGLTEKPTIREPWKPEPCYDKVPIDDCDIRTNADLHPMTPIDEVPEFHQPHASPEARKARHTFGKKQEATPAPQVVARPLDAVKEERTLAANVSSPVFSDEESTAPTPAPETNEPEAQVVTPQLRMVSRTEDADVAPAERLAAPDTPTLSSTQTGAEEATDFSTVDRVKMEAIREAVAEVGEALVVIPTGDSTLTAEQSEQVRKAYERTENLLEQVDEVRGDSGMPLSGDLGDLWWDLINLKTQADKMTSRFPKELADNRTEG